MCSLNAKLYLTNHNFIFGKFIQMVPLNLTSFFQVLLLMTVVSTLNYSQYPNIRVSSERSTSPEEVTITIDPQNPMNLFAAANIDFFYNSTDGGQTWNEHRLSSTLGVWGDPCVIHDNDGNLYYSHLSNPPFGYWIDRIVVQKSTDGGNTWDEGASVGLTPPKNQDKEWMAYDKTESPYKGNLYMAWTEFDMYGSPDINDKSRILFSRSVDKSSSWSAPFVVSDITGSCLDDDNTVEGAVPAVGPDGEIYLSWSGHEVLMFDKSLDGGEKLW